MRCPAERNGGSGFLTNFMSYVDGSRIFLEFVVIYMSDMLPFKAHIQNGTFKRSTLKKRPSTSKTKQRPASRATKTDTMTSASHARTQVREDYKAAANDYIRNWRKSSASSRRVTSRTTSLTLDAQSLPPSTIVTQRSTARPKTSHRAVTSSTHSVRSRPKTGTTAGVRSSHSIDIS